MLTKLLSGDVKRAIKSGLQGEVRGGEGSLEAIITQTEPKATGLGENT